MALSDPLADLLGEVQLSRPQTVKKIWEYVKARDLQDPSDRRQIRCDDAMRAVFKTDSVHMFTMNKILNQNLYPVETPAEEGTPVKQSPSTTATPMEPSPSVGAFTPVGVTKPLESTTIVQSPRPAPFQAAHPIGTSTSGLP